ncbi:hypothetical protein E3N88_08835 [Mikania micrantha]|uniref:Uncharacterized protein n=1 Tax=Mikania micrantha TaxID=192012 RepID=A0A5N6PHD1_9ASTR|nr:hypothetical protein E3N88_08835 [Mikania micrantha]
MDGDEEWDWERLDHDLNLPKEYAELLMAVIPPLTYKSLDELKVILSKGVLLHEGKRAEHEVLEDERVNMQPISDLDSDWEQHLPNDCEEIIKWSEDGVQWTTKKELHSLLCKGFSIKNGGEWFFLAKNGKKCYMLPAGAALIDTQWSWRPLTGSRFKLEAYNPIKKCVHIECKIKTRILSPQETYACYLVYKLPEDHSEFDAPLKVRDKDFDKEDWDDINYNHEHLRKEGWEETDYRFIFLVRPPETPFIGRKVDQLSSNRSLSRSKLKGLPRPRADGWMEVQVWEFQTRTSPEMILMRVDLVSAINILLKGLIVQGIEFRPV